MFTRYRMKIICVLMTVSCLVTGCSSSRVSEHDYQQIKKQLFVRVHERPQDKRSKKERELEISQLKKEYLRYLSSIRLETNADVNDLISELYFYDLLMRIEYCKRLGTCRPNTALTRDLYSAFLDEIMKNRRSLTEYYSAEHIE